MTWYVDTSFGRLIQRIVSLPWWLKASLVLGLLAMPFVLAFAQRAPIFPLANWDLRGVFFPIVVTAYVIAVTPAIWRAEQAVVEGLRPLVQYPLTAASGAGAWWRSSWGDWAAFSLGALGGLLLLAANRPGELQWVDWYMVVALIVMYGATAWQIYAAMGSARMTALLHRTLSPHNPFDLSPFEPIGRQALVLALVFVGGITLSLLFVYTPELFFSWGGLFIYAVLTFTTLSLFFGVMWPAHRTLAGVKADKLAAVQRLVAQHFDQLESTLNAGAPHQPVAGEFETWLTIAHRLDQTPTWPYNLVMLRTLALSVLTPMFVALFRVIGVWLSEGHL